MQKTVSSSLSDVCEKYYLLMIFSQGIAYEILIIIKGFKVECKLKRGSSQSEESPSLTMSTKYSLCKTLMASTGFIRLSVKDPMDMWPRLFAKVITVLLP